MFRLSLCRFLSSYAHGASNIPLFNKTVGQVLREITEVVPDRLCQVVPHQNIRKTFAEFLKDSEKCASGLISMGVNRGDRVGIWATNDYEWVVTQFATALAGMILVNINPGYRPEELEFCLIKSGIKAVIASRSFKTQDYYQMLCAVCPELADSKAGQLQSKKFPELKHIFFLGDDKPSGTWTFSDLMSAGDSASDKKLNELERKVQTDEPVNIQFTSGTTGAPKGATLSHHNIVNNAYFAGHRMGFHQQHHIVLCGPPLYHCFGCVLGSLGMVMHKGTNVMPAPTFKPLPSLEAIHNEKCTAIYGTPTMFIDMLSQPRFNEFKYDSLVTGLMSGAPCPIETCRELIDRMHLRDLLLGYGSTECSPLICQQFREKPLIERIDSVGPPTDHVEVKLIDHEGKTVPLGERGEVCVRGYLIMLGYWNDKAKTEDVVGQDRWYKTGDVGVMAPDGDVSIVGRMKEMVIRGGENLYPTEIEQIIHQHEDVEDVHIVGVPDPRMGEELCAWIRVKADKELSEEDVRQFCKGKIAHFKIPRYIFIKKEHQFPITVTGKVQKFKIREIATKELGLGVK